MFRKMLCVFAVVVLLPLGFAQASVDNWAIDENGMKIFFKHRDEWTFVTPDNVEDHMELCTSRGYTEQEVRGRFASGRIVWEAYHKRTPNGFLRYEVWSDELTRNAWDLNQLSSQERKDWMELAFATWGGSGTYTFVNPSYSSIGKENHIIKTGIISNPPAIYESGYGGLFIRNGQAMLTSYIQTNDRASRQSYNKQLYEFTSSEAGYTNWNESVFVPELQDEAVDLTTDNDLIVNEHTGEITLRGASENGAAITAAWGNYTAEATAGSDGAFEVSVPVTVEGEMAVSLTASKKGYTDNYASVLSVPVDNAAARLVLTDYPQTTVDDEPVRVSGFAAPNAIVFLTLDGEDPVMLIAGDDGAFTHTFEDVEYFLSHTLTVTANEEGLRDATVTLPFILTYVQDIQKGISAFKKKTVSLSSYKLSQNPSEYIGEFIRMEFRTTGVTREDGGLTLEAKSLDGDTRRPMILKTSGYLDDVIVDGMNITVYGIVEAPTNEDGLPQIRIVYVTYLKVTYQ